MDLVCDMVGADISNKENMHIRLALQEQWCKTGVKPKQCDILGISPSRIVNENLFMGVSKDCRIVDSDMQSEKFGTESLRPERLDFIGCESRKREMLGSDKEGM